MLKNLRIILIPCCTTMLLALYAAESSRADSGSAMPSPTVLNGTNWNSLGFTSFSALEAVDAQGNPTYPANQFPIKMEGIVLNNPVDMTDSATGVSPYSAAQPATFNAFNPNPYWQVFVQTVNVNNNGDFGGAAVYAAQNYANVTPPFPPDLGLSYSASGWTNDVNRISNNNTIQAGDLVIIEALGGEGFGGKFNINEEHQVNANTQFQIVVLSTGNSIPITNLHLSDIWDNTNNRVLFDPTGATGGEHYQSTMVRLEDVELVSEQAADWKTNGSVQVQDTSGRQFTLELGTNSNFTPANAPTSFFDVTGIFDQEGGGGNSQDANGYFAYTENYELWVMDPTTVTAVPEPQSIALAVLGITGLWSIRRRKTPLS